VYIVRDKNGPGTGGSKTTRSFHTYGGNLDKKYWPEYVKALQFPLTSVCAEPLKYLTISASGEAYMCCRDGGLSGKIGSVNEQGINDIWHSDKLQIARQILKQGRRDLIIPCILCNSRTFRHGLYPYWGKEYSKGEIERALYSLSYLDKKEPVYSNIMDLVDSGWKPGEIIQKVLEEAK
jgi:radical SAM protein with 4Fe4S-binding SPASM domain